MNKDFIPYELALALKELEFDEPCFAIHSFVDGELNFMYVNNFHSNDDVNELSAAAPLYQQAFRWFREKYRLDGHVTFRESTTNKIEGINSVYYDVEIYTLMSGDAYKTYNFKEISDKKEEAELACLIKLIEIVKTK